MSKTNIIQVDLRQLTNKELYEISNILQSAKIRQELAVREFDSCVDLLGNRRYEYGKFPTLEQYLNSLPEPQYKDTRNEGGC